MLRVVGSLSNFRSVFLVGKRSNILWSSRSITVMATKRPISTYRVQPTCKFFYIYVVIIIFRCVWVCMLMWICICFFFFLNKNEKEKKNENLCGFFFFVYSDGFLNVYICMCFVYSIGWCGDYKCVYGIRFIGLFIGIFGVYVFVYWLVIFIWVGFFFVSWWDTFFFLSLFNLDVFGFVLGINFFVFFYRIWNLIYNCQNVEDTTFFFCFTCNIYIYVLKMLQIMFENKFIYYDNFYILIINLMFIS